MRRNSSFVFIVMPFNVILPVPWVNNAPDFSAFNEPTLSVLQQSWQQFLDSGQELEIIPDPEPFVEPPPARWTPFNFALFLDQDFIAYCKIAEEVNPCFVPALIERYGRVAKEGLQESDFPSYWQSFCLAFNVSAEHRNEWATLAERFDLPDDFVSIIRG